MREAAHWRHEHDAQRERAERAEAEVRELRSALDCIDDGSASPDAGFAKGELERSLARLPLAPDDPQPVREP